MSKLTKIDVNQYQQFLDSITNHIRLARIKAVNRKTALSYEFVMSSCRGY